MKKASLILIGMTVIFSVFLGGFFLGRNANRSPIRVSRNTDITQSTALPPSSTTGVKPVDLNTATLDELETLPGIGKVLALRILDYRDAHGAFRSVWELANVEGMGEKKIQAILDHITVGGNV